MKPIAVSGMAIMTFLVTTRCEPLIEMPSPPPMATPWITATVAARWVWYARSIAYSSEKNVRLVS